MTDPRDDKQTEPQSALKDRFTGLPRWLGAALWALVSPPTAFLYVGRPGWAGAGFAGVFVWIIFCLVADFEARIYSLVILFIVGLIYAALPVIMALFQRRHGYTRRTYNNFQWYMCSLVAVLFLFVLINLTSARIIGIGVYGIPTDSMENTLYPGDYILADMRAYDRAEPQRGDVVIHAHPKHPSAEDQVKRIAALPGDTIQIKYKLLYVNSRLINPPRSATYQDPNRIFPAEMSSRDNLGPFVLPPGMYFVLGDNRDNSLDSRLWGQGPGKPACVPRGSIKGRAILIVYSIEGLVTRLERIGQRLDGYNG